MCIRMLLNDATYWPGNTFQLVLLGTDSHDLYLGDADHAPVEIDGSLGTR